mgnify:CR=1 FL=1
MKKKIACLILVLICSSIFAQEKIKNLIVVPSSQNLTAAEDAWLTDAIKEKVESNLMTYAGMQLVSSNSSAIKKLQRKSEGAGYDKSTSIELGKLVNASHAAFLTVRKAGNLYTVTLEFANLTTGVLVTKSVSTGKNKVEELFSTYGCAVDELTIDLCQKLNVKLSGTQIYILKNGPMEIAGSNQVAMYDQELENYNRQIQNYDKEIARLKADTSLEAETQRIKILAEKATAEQKKKAVEENKKRIYEIEKAKREEEALNAGRSEEQKKRISDAAKNANDASNRYSNFKVNSIDAMTKIKILEAKKSAFVEYKRNIADEKLLVKQQYETEYAKKIKELKNKPWRTGDRNSDGSVAKDAIEQRNREVKKLEEERDNYILEAQKKIDDDTYHNMLFLLEDVYTEELNLSKYIFYANTINKNLRVKIGNYGRNIDGWRISYTVLADGAELLSGSSVLEYDKLVRIFPVQMDKFDAIDMFDSLFKSGEPVLTFAYDYKASGKENTVSSYTFKGHGALRVYNTINMSVSTDGNIAGKNIKIENTLTSEKNISPEYDVKGLKLKNKENELIKLNNKVSYRILNGYKIIEKERLDEIIKKQKKLGLNIELNSNENASLKMKVYNGQIYKTQYKKIVGKDSPNIKQTGKFLISDAALFCNELSKKSGLTPVYSIDETNTVISVDYTADGYRIFGDNEEIDFIGKTFYPFESFGVSRYIDLSNTVLSDDEKKILYEKLEKNRDEDVKEEEKRKTEIITTENKQQKEEQNQVEYSWEEEKQKFVNYIKTEYMVQIPSKNYQIGKTEITQGIYEIVTGKNPSSSYSFGDIAGDFPVNGVSWYDAVIFCNKLSELCGLTPVYSVDGSKDINNWGYNEAAPAKFNKIIKMDITADGFRLPTVNEWEYAARGERNYIYSGSDNLDDVAWHGNNSGYHIHKVAQKKPNGYGLYDMTGNVSEWCWDTHPNEVNCRYEHGGSYGSSSKLYPNELRVDSRVFTDVNTRHYAIGFRIARATK